MFGYLVATAVTDESRRDFALTRHHRPPAPLHTARHAVSLSPRRPCAVVHSGGGADRPAACVRCGLVRASRAQRGCSGSAALHRPAAVAAARRVLARGPRARPTGRQGSSRCSASLDGRGWLAQRRCEGGCPRALLVGLLDFFSSDK